MSELRVDKIVSSGTISVSGITTFSGTSGVLLDISTNTFLHGNINVVSGDYAKAIRVYTGNSYITI